MLAYLALVFFDDDGFVIQFPGLSSTFSGGQSEREALARAAIALEEALGRFAATWTAVPPPSPLERGQVLVEARVLGAEKSLPLNAAAERSVTRADLAQRLGLTARQAGLLCDPRHPTGIDAVAMGMEVLGRRLSVTLGMATEPDLADHATGSDAEDEEEVAVRLARLEQKLL